MIPANVSGLMNCGGFRGRVSRGRRLEQQMEFSHYDTLLRCFPKLWPLISSSLSSDQHAIILIFLWEGAVGVGGGLPLCFIPQSLTPYL